MSSRVLDLVNRLVMIGVIAVGVGNSTYYTNDPQDVRNIQDQVIMDINDIIALEKEVKDRREKGEKQLCFNNYWIQLK